MRWRRTIRAVGVGTGADADAVERAARLDLVNGYLERADLLAGDEVAFVPVSAGVPG